MRGPSLQTLISSVKSRVDATGGIGLAIDYLSAIGPCLTDDRCTSKFLGMGSERDWDLAIKEAEQKLVYRHDDDLDFKELNAGTPKSLMDFDCVITTTKKDRDGDVMESGGAIPDPRMPLLWQHIPMEPIGKLIEITGHTSSRISGHFAIADTDLGKDAATLVQFGALRISHGFRPLDFEPLQKRRKYPKSDPADPSSPDGDGAISNDDGEVSRWRVRKFEIMETSLVSVPSNTDAVITAWSRGKLTHPLVKSWAQRFNDSRPVTVRGGWAGTDQGSQKMAIDINVNVNGAPAASAKSGDACACHSKDSIMGQPDARKVLEGKIQLVAQSLQKHCSKDYGQAFVHHDKAHVHYTIGDGDEHGEKARKAFSDIDGVDKVSVVSEKHPPKDKGYKMVHPKMVDWVTDPKNPEKDEFGGSTSTGGGAASTKPNVKGAVDYEATPKADFDKSWDSSQAVGHLRSWAGMSDTDTLDMAFKKFRRGFAYFDGKGVKMADFKLPHHDVDSGTLCVVFKGVVASMAALNGARGGMTMSPEDRKATYAHLARHYRQFGQEPPDLKMVPTVSAKTLWEIYMRKAGLIKDRTMGLDPATGTLDQSIDLGHTGGLGRAPAQQGQPNPTQDGTSDSAVLGHTGAGSNTYSEPAYSDDNPFKPAPAPADNGGSADGAPLTSAPPTRPQTGDRYTGSEPADLGDLYTDENYFNARDSLPGDTQGSEELVNETSQPGDILEDAQELVNDVLTNATSNLTPAQRTRLESIRSDLSGSNIDNIVRGSRDLFTMIYEMNVSEDCRRMLFEARVLASQAASGLANAQQFVSNPPKSRFATGTKEGRMLSSRNEQAIRSAHGFVEKAFGHLKDVLAAHDAAMGGGPASGSTLHGDGQVLNQTRSWNDTACKLLSAILLEKAGDIPDQTLKSLMETCEQELRMRQEKAFNQLVTA